MNSRLNNLLNRRRTQTGLTHEVPDEVPLVLRDSPTVREKFRKKGLAPKGKEAKIKAIKRRVKVYVHEQCNFVNEQGIRCKKKAIGKGVMCQKHGGVKDIMNTLSPEATLLYLEEQPVTALTFVPEIHPLQYIDLSRQGFSEVEIASEMGIGVPTLLAWADRFSAMAIAVEIGKALHETWWLKEGKEGLKTRSFNTPLYKYITGNKLGWSEKTESRNTNMNISGVLVVPPKQTAEEWASDCIETTCEEIKE